MKKIFVILMVAFIAMAGLFAADGYKATESATKASANGQAQIQILTTITQEWPKFQLATTSGVVADAKDLVSNPLTAVTATLTDAQNEDLTESDNGTVSVGFAIKQVSDSRTNDIYDLTVAVTNLVLVRPIGANADTAWETAVATEDTTAKFDVVAAAPAVTAGTVTNITLVGGNGTLTVTYNGKKIKAADDNTAKTLGTFTAEWTTNTEAQAGNYEAHVTLGVTAR